MELRHIRYFLTLADEKSFTRAAEKLDMAQPPLSRQIKDLENELGAQLFRRGRRGVSLTPAGLKFYEYARQIFTLTEKSEEAIRQMNQGLQGTLYLSIVEGMAPHLMSLWLTGFHKKFPQVQFQIWNGNSDGVAERLREGLCDLAILMGPYDQEGFDGLFLNSEPWVAMIPVDHPLAEKHRNDIDIDLAELLPYDLIIPSRQSRLNEITGWFGSALSENEHPRMVARIANMLNAYELTARSMGIAIFPASVGNYADRRKVVIKNLANPAVQATYYMVTESGRDLSLVEQEFLDYVSAAVGQERES